MPADSVCPSLEPLRRSLDPDDPMTASERQRIEAHVDRCNQGCKQALDALLRGNTLSLAPGVTRPGKAASASSIAATDETPPAPPGYEILGELGRGGMGVVYRARQRALGRVVALKMLLHPLNEAEAEEHARFTREALAIASLNHGSIVQIYELGRHGDRPFIAMELVEGGSLAERLAGIPQPPRQAAALVERLAEAVQAAHQQQIIHRDLKPANILVAADGTPKITDFGLAKRLDVESTESVGKFLGTASYAAPEQALGRLHEMGATTDVYGLGAILYEMLTGRPPFRAATTWETLQQVVSSEPVPPSRLAVVPRDLETICLKCLAKERARRYVLARGLAEDLRLYQAGQPIRARPVGWPERLVKWVKRRPAVAALAGAVVFVVVVGLATSLALAGWAFRERDRAGDRLAEAQQADRRRVQAQVEQLGSAAPEAVPGLLAALKEDREAVLQLRELWAEESGDRQRRLRAGLALVDDPAVRGPLADWMIEAEDPREVLLVREVLAPHCAGLVEGLWNTVDDPKVKVEVRFRALVALAAFDPANPRWTQAAPTAVELLLKADPLFLGLCMQALRPVRDQLHGPLAEVFRGKHRHLADYRLVAATVLADYAVDRPAELANLLLDADEKQFAVIYPKFKEHGEQGLPVLTGAIDRNLPPDANEDAKEKLAKRQANAAVALLRMDQPAKVWPLLKHGPDSRARSYLIHRFGPLGAEAGPLVKHLEEETDATIQRALILSLGPEEFGEQAWTPEGKKLLVQQLQELYRTAADPGLHGAAEWLLRQWHQEQAIKEAEQAWAKDQRHREQRLQQIREGFAKGKGEGCWYVNGQGQTLVVIPGPVEFLMGSPPSEAGRTGGPEGQIELQHKKRIGRSFAMAAKEVTVEQFLRFRQGHSYNKQYAPTADCPINAVMWYEAAAYCNWLSQQEGIPQEQWCYEPNDKNEFAEGMKPKPNYLGLEGYRLPSEAEWEFACRAGAVTSRCYGESEDLLGKYAWLTKNSQNRWMVPGGTLKPNDLGLFDMLGNTLEWCQEQFTYYSPVPGGGASEDKEYKEDIKSNLSRVLRGGLFDYQAVVVRSALRDWNLPSIRLDYVGFRPARTFR